MPQPIRARRKRAPRPDQPARSWPRQMAVGIVLAAVGIAVYANSLHAPFVFDAQSLIFENPAIQKVWLWLTSFGGGLGNVGGNRPVGFLSFALNYAWGGYDVRGYHAVNVAIHVAGAWLLFDIVRRTLARGRLAARYAAHAW